MSAIIQSKQYVSLLPFQIDCVGDMFFYHAYQSMGVSEVEGRSLSLTINLPNCSAISLSA